MMAIQIEIQQLRAKMRAAPIALNVLPQADPTEVVVDLFSPKEIPLPFLEKRPHIDDPKAVRLKMG